MVVCSFRCGYGWLCVCGYGWLCVGVYVDMNGCVYMWIWMVVCSCLCGYEWLCVVVYVDIVCVCGRLLRWIFMNVEIGMCTRCGLDYGY